MKINNGLFFLVLVLAVWLPMQVPAFTVINQTDTEKHVEVLELKHYPQDWDKPSNLREQIAFSTPHKLTIPAKSSVQFNLTKECPAILCGVQVTLEKTAQSKKTIKNIAVYSACGDGKQKALLTNRHGIVIHDPMPSRKSIANYGRDDFEKKLFAEQCFGISCFNPYPFKIITSYNKLSREIYEQGCGLIPFYVDEGVEDEEVALLVVEKLEEFIDGTKIKEVFMRGITLNREKEQTTKTSWNEWTVTCGTEQR
jgi:hypothetical protein